MTRLKNRIAVVTGVSRRKGIGAAVCLALAEEGADVFFTYCSSYERRVTGFELEEHWADRFAGELRELGARAGHAELDLTQAETPARLLDAVEERLGLPAILVNNATYSMDADFRQLTAELIDLHCAVNIRGTLMLTAEFARRLEGRGSGSIVNLVSGQDKGPMPGNLAYAATKGAVSAFTVSLAAELAPLRITVNAVDPGPTDTGWMSEELKRELLPRSPMGRLGLPADAARLIAFLASDDACWITGQIIHSDGGFRT